MCTDITLSAPVLYITSTLDTIESLSDTAQGLGYPQVPRGREVVQLLKYFGSMCFREYELRWYLQLESPTTCTRHH